MKQRIHNTQSTNQHINQKGTAMKASMWLSLGLVLVLALLIPSTAFATGTPAGTKIQNFATLAYKDSSGTSFPTVYSDTAEVTVQQKAGIAVTPVGWAKVSGDSANVDYPATVTNTGNGTEAEINLTIAREQSGWAAVAMYVDADSNGVLSPAELGAGAITSLSNVTADESRYIIIRVFVPDGASNDTRDTLLLTATSGFDSDIKDFQHDTVTVKVADFTSTPPTKSNDNGTPNPGSTIEYSITFTNSGSSNALNAVVRDTLPGTVTYAALTASTVDGSTQGTVSHSSGVVTWSVGTIPAGKAATLTFTVTVNTGVAAGTTISNSANITFTDSVGNRPKGPTPTPPTTSTVQQVGNWMLRVDEGSVTATFPTNNYSDSTEVTVPLYYRLRLTNTGNTTDTASLSRFSSLPLSWTLFVDRDSSGTFNAGDTAWVTGANTGGLAPGQNLYFLAYDTTAQGVNDRSLDSTSYTFASLTVSASAEGYHLTRIKAPVISLTKAVVLQSGTSRPGDTLIYTITYSNNGSGDAKYVVINDAIPANTTYLAGSVEQEVNGGGFTSRTDASDTDNTTASQGGGVSVNVGTIGGKIVGSPTYTGKIRFMVKIN